MTRVLIVEDNAKTAAQLSKALLENFFIADIAKDGQEGLFLATQQIYDVIILDVMLPHIDGWSVLKKLREQNHYTLVLFLTACDAVVGNMIARKSMHYIQQFSEKLENMALDSLEVNKINLCDWPDELQPVATSFNRMLNKLQASYQQLSQFSADIAHELRTPIHNLLGMNEAALTSKKPFNPRDVLESNLEECKQLLKLIEILLFIARSDHGQVVLNKKMLQARADIASLIDYYEPLASEDRISLSCDGSAIIVVDAILFKRVISNVLSNALRHTPQGGRIAISIESSAEWVSFALFNTGVGIPEEHLAKLCDRFYRADMARATHTGGLGLGLAIVKSIMDLHRGTLNIKSQINSGTEVQLRFPVLVAL